METMNLTIVTELILLGLSEDLNTNITLFFLFFVTYLITVFGNCLIICIIIMTSKLHTPMYFFICNLSIIDLSYSTTAVPRLLADLFSTLRIISIAECTAQVYLIMFLGTTEALLLALMAYDRYVAICHGLYYPVLMSWRICYKMTTFVWIGSFMLSVVPVGSMPITLCFPNKIDHFVCEALGVLELACEEIYVNEIIMYALSFLSLILPFGFIIVTYICIITSVIKIHSVGRSKAFSTCTSHLTVVCLCYGTAMLIYFGPSSNFLLRSQKHLSVVYIIVNPMTNTLVYSLNNKDVRVSIRRLLEKMSVSNPV